MTMVVLVLFILNKVFFFTKCFAPKKVNFSVVDEIVVFLSLTEHRHNHHR